MDRAARLIILKDPELVAGASVRGSKSGAGFTGRIVEVAPDPARCIVRYVVLTDSSMRTGLFGGTHLVTVTVPGSDHIVACREGSLARRIGIRFTAAAGWLKLAFRVVAVLLIPLGLAAGAGYPMFIFEESLQSQGLSASTACTAGDPFTAARAIEAYEATLLKAQAYCDGLLGRLAFYQRDAYREYFFRAAPLQLDALRAKAVWAGADPASVAPTGQTLDGIPVLRERSLLTKTAYEDTTSIPTAHRENKEGVDQSSERWAPPYPGSDGIKPAVQQRRDGLYAVWYADRWHTFDDRAAAAEYLARLDD